MERPARATALVTALLATGSALLVWGARLVAATATSGHIATPTAQSAERLVVAGAGLGLAAVGAWLCVATTVCVGDLVRRRTILAAGPLRPRAVRRALLRACAPTVGAAVVWAGGPAVAGDLDGLPLPDRPVVSAPVDGSAEPRAGRTVAPGDCLWTIAAGLLGPGASAAEVDRAWRAIYRVNRDRVGADPDLVRAGTRLALPRSLRQSPHPSR